jgi:hypothetical protein
MLPVTKMAIIVPDFMVIRLSASVTLIFGSLYRPNSKETLMYMLGAGTEEACRAMIGG